MELSSLNLEKLLYYRRELAKPEKKIFILPQKKVFPHFRMTSDRAIK